MDGSSFITTTRPQAETQVEGVTAAQPEPAAADMPKAIGTAIIGSFGFTMLSFMAFFGGTAQSVPAAMMVAALAMGVALHVAR